MSEIVCSTTHVFHYLFNDGDEMAQSLLKVGLRPLSYFGETERWKQIQAHRPGMFKWIYEEFAKPVVQKESVDNSGIFVTPIDFYKLLNTFLHDKRRVAVPLERIDSEWTTVTYELNGERKSLPFTQKTMEAVADLWREDLVREWFGKDNSKVFFYVPQIATYQPNGIPVFADDIQTPEPEVVDS